MASPATDLRTMDDEELDQRLAEARQELFNLRFQIVTGSLDNSARIRQVRRQVARIMTIQREREIEAAEALEAEALEAESFEAGPGAASESAETGAR